MSACGDPLPCTQHTLYCPRLEELVDPLQTGLLAHFEHVDVRVAPCPDLTQGDFGLCFQGLGGPAELADVGGVDNLHYAANHGVEFNVDDVVKALGRPNACVLGAGAGCASFVGCNSEWMPNVRCGDHEANGCRLAKVNPSDGSVMVQPHACRGFGLLANLLVCDGLPGDVLCVTVSRRRANGKADVVSAIADAVRPLGAGKGGIGLAGVVRVDRGSVRAHVMPDFPSCDMTSADEVQQWLHYYTMEAPLTCLSVAVTEDAADLGLRLEHTHFFDPPVAGTGVGGHYHHDVSPETIAYSAYLVPCHRITRVAPAQVPH